MWLWQHWENWVRICNIIGSFIGLWWLGLARRRQWDTWNEKTRQHWYALGGWVFLCLEGSVEALWLQVVPGPRTIITSLVLAWTLRAIWIPQELSSKPALHRKPKE